MASPGKIALSPGTAIPFNKLFLSQRNVRRIHNGQTIPELADDIYVRGLLTSLNVRPEVDASGKATGRYGVPAGGRRFRALELLVKTKRMSKTEPVPCIVKAADSAIPEEEDSLAENVHREALHPLDQYRAFKALVDQGLSLEDVAARFFVTPLVVRQRLKLAAVSPRLLALYAEDKLTLQQLMAFTLTHDHARQEQVWDGLANSYNREAYAIRDLLQKHSVAADDRRALFVGLEVYEAAGGTVARDLFQNHDGGGWFENVALLDRLVQERLQRVAGEVMAEGWKWVEVAADFPYGHTAGLHRLRPTPAPLCEEDAARADALRVEYDALHEEYEGADELPEAVDQRLAEIEQLLEALDARTVRFEPDWIARAGAFVSVGSDGLPRIERGFVRAEDVLVAPEAAASSASPDADVPTGTVVRAVLAVGGTDAPVAPPTDTEEDEGERPLTERLMTELSTHRTMALREALANDPDAAFLAVLHAMALKVFHTFADDTCLEIRVQSTAPDRTVHGLNEAPGALSLIARKETWAGRLPGKPKELWGFLLDLDADSRADLFALCAGLSLNALHQPHDRRPNALLHADRIAELVGLDMSEHWTPTADNFFARITKGRILAAVREAKGEAASQLIDHLRKPDMAREAERLIAGTGWLPQPLRSPGRGACPMSKAEDAASAPADPAMQEAPAVLPVEAAGDEALPAFLVDAETGEAGAMTALGDPSADAGGDLDRCWNIDAFGEDLEHDVDAHALVLVETPARDATVAVATR